MMDLPPPAPSLSLVLRNLFSFDSEDGLKRWSSFIGIVVAIVGNLLISLALNIQKYAHIRLERESTKRQRLWRRRRRWLRSRSRSAELPDETGFASPSDSSSSGSLSPPPPDESSALLPRDEEDTEKDSPALKKQLYLRSPYWWIGFVLMSVGECGNFLAYGFAPASIVSPLGVVALVSNCVIAPVVLKEPLRKRDMIGVVISILGAVTVVWSAEKQETKLGPDQILEAISQTAFEVYFGITCAMIIVLMYLSSRYGRKTILIDLGLVALFGGYTVLSTKGISSLLSSSFYHIFTYPIAYLFTTVLLLTAILQIKYVNRALQRFDSTQVIPTQFVLFTISVITGSAILYRDFETVKPERMLKFCTGCALTFWGVWMISTRRKAQLYDEDLLDDLDDGYGYNDYDCNTDGASKRSRVNSISIPNNPPPRPRPSPHSSMALLESAFPATAPSSRTGSYIPSGAPISIPPPLISRRTSRSSMAGGGTHKRSLSNLLPGPIALKAVMGDFAHEEAGGRDGGEGRRRSGSLGVVLDLLKKQGRMGLGEMEEGENEGEDQGEGGGTGMTSRGEQGPLGK